jgi:hypothetical protein
VIANSVRSWMLQDETPDKGCGLKLFSKDAFLDLPYFDHMHRFLPALIKRRGPFIYSRNLILIKKDKLKNNLKVFAKRIKYYLEVYLHQKGHYFKWKLKQLCNMQ